MTSAQVLESRALLTAVILEPTAGQQTSDRTPTIRWSDDNAQTYEVWVSVLGSNPQSVHIQSGIAGTSYDVPTDLAIEDHRVWVRSHYANGQTSSWSAPRDFEVIAPTVPAPVTTSNVTANSATVSWNAVPGASTYDVYVREDGIGLAQRPLVTSTSVTVSGLNAQAAHTVWVQAVNPNGSRSAWSQPVGFTTHQGGTTTGPLSRPVPTGLSSALSTTVTPAWNDVSGADYYTLWVSSTGNTQAIVLQENLTDTEFEITTLTAGSSYRYWVRAHSVDGRQSVWSLPETFNVPTSGSGQLQIISTSGPVVLVNNTSVRVLPGLDVTISNSNNQYSNQPTSLNTLEIGAGSTVTVSSLNLNVQDFRLAQNASLIGTSELGLYVSNAGTLEESSRLEGQILNVGGNITVKNNAAVVSTFLAVGGNANWILDGQPADSDFDDLNDIEEYFAGTISGNPDTDGDWLLDGYEARYAGLNPLVPVSAVDRQSDTDDDGLNLLQEHIFGTNPSVWDTDADGVSDFVESGQGSNPTNSGDAGIAPLPEDLVSVNLKVGDPSGR